MKKFIIITALIFVGFLKILAQTDIIFEVTKTTDPDIFQYEFDYNDSLCDPELVGTLRWAFMKAALAPELTVNIVFNISGVGPHTIELLYELPMLQRKVKIDGRTQPGYQHGTPAVIIDGMGQVEKGIYLYKASKSEIKGLCLRNFTYHGILLNLTQETIITRNVIYNIFRTGNEITLGDGAIGLINSKLNVIMSNLIGTDNSGSALLKNRYGINLQNYPSRKINLPGTSSNFIGGDQNYEANKIANSTYYGIWVGASCVWNTISRNSLTNNSTAIFLSPPDDIFLIGGNYNKPAPVITAVSNGIVTGISYQDDVIELFGSTGNENANEFLAATHCDSTGYWELQGVNTAFEYLIATATDFKGNSSEMSDTMPVFLPGPNCYFENVTEIVNPLSPVTNLFTCTRYIFRYEIDWAANAQWWQNSPSTQITINLPNGITFQSLISPNDVTTNSPVGSQSPVFTVPLPTADPFILDIEVLTPPCSSVVQPVATTLTGSNCNSLPYSVNTSYPITEPSLFVNNIASGALSVNTGDIREFVYHIRNNSSNNQPIPDICIFFPDFNANHVISYINFSYYLTAAPSLQTTPINIYTYTPPLQTTYQFTPGVRNSLNQAILDIFSHPELQQNEEFYLHIPYIVEIPEIIPDGTCPVLTTNFEFSWSCAGVNCNPCETLSESVNLNINSGDPSVVATFPPGVQEYGSYCNENNDPNEIFDIEFIIKNIGTELGGNVPPGNGKGTDIVIYIYNDTRLGTLDGNFQISANGYSFTIIAPTPSQVTLGGVNYDVFRLDFKSLAVVQGDWEPIGPNSLADLDGDEFTDDLDIGSSFIITCHYRYKNCPLDVLHENCGNKTFYIVSAYAEYNNMCKTRNIPVSTNYPVSTNNTSYQYSIAYTQPAALQPPNDVETGTFMLDVNPGTFYERFVPASFEFNCPDGRHIIRLKLPPGYHLDVNSLSTIVVYDEAPGTCSNTYELSPPIDVQCRFGCITPQPPAQQITPTVQEFCPAGGNPGFLEINLGELPKCNCGSLDETFFLGTFNSGTFVPSLIKVPVYFGCEVEYPLCGSQTVDLTGSNNDVFEATLLYECDNDCPDCSICIMKTTGSSVHHCIDICDNYLGTLQNTFIIERENAGWVNVPQNDFYQECETNFNPVTAVIPQSNKFRAYPGDLLKLRVEGLYNPAPNLLPVLNGASFQEIFLEIKYDFIVPSPNNQVIFDFENTLGFIKITNNATSNFQNIDAIDIVFQTQEINNQVFMVFQIPQYGIDFIDDITTTYRIDVELYLTVKTSQTGMFFIQGLYNMNNIRAVFSGVDESGTDQISCDSWGTDFNILQPRTQVSVITDHVANIVDCSPFKLIIDFFNFKAESGSSDFPGEFRPFSTLRDITITLPDGYIYTSGTSTLNGSLINNDSNADNDYGATSYLFSEPIPLDNEIYNSNNNTLKFTGIDLESCWPLIDLKNFTNNNPAHPRNQILIPLQAECTALDEDIVSCTGSYDENLSSYDPNDIVNFTFDNTIPISHVSPELVVNPPTNPFHAYGNTVTFQFTVINSGANANNAWIAIQNPSGYINLLTDISNDYPDTYFDSNNNVLVIGLGNILAPSATIYTITFEINNPLGCISGDMEQDQILVFAGNECNPGVPIENYFTSEGCLTGDAVIFLYNLYRSELQLVFTELDGLPQPSNFCNPEIEYHLLIQSINQGTVTAPTFQVELPVGVTLANIEFNYPFNSTNSCTPSNPDFGVLNNPGWNLNNCFQDLTDHGLTGSQTNPDNQILVTLTLNTDCDYNATDFINFITTGTSSCNQTLVSIVNDRPEYTNAEPADDFVVTTSVEYTPYGSSVTCNNQADITIVITYPSVVHQNTLTVELPGNALPADNIDPTPYNYMNNVLTWDISPTQTPFTEVFTFTLAFSDDVFYCWPNGFTITPVISYSETVDCPMLPEGCTLSNTISYEPVTVFACCPCEAIITSQTDVTCYGGNDGSATATLNGTSGAFTYLWSDGQATQTATHLTAGAYSVTVEDLNDPGCSSVAYVTITQPEEFSAFVQNQSDVSCSGLDNGSFTIGVNNGVSPFTYNIGTGAVSFNTFSHLSGGNYSVTVTDANGCIATTGINIFEPELLTVSFNTTPSCISLSNGTATANPSGGVTPYSYLWSDGQTAQTASNLPAGVCSVTVTDANACIVSEQTTIDVFNTPVTASYDIIPENIIQGVSTTFTYTGTGADWVEWNIDGTVTSDFTVEHLFDDYGYYCVTLTASNFCSSEITNAIVYVYPSTCTLPESFHIYDGYEVNGNEIWDNNFLPGVTEILVEGDIIIKPFSILFIQHKSLKFSPKGRIIVERGAILAIENSALTSLPGNTCSMWQGIEVWGRPGLYSSIFQQGKVFLKYSTISNAHIGVLLGKRILPGCANTQQFPFDNTYNGGFIYSFSTEFDRNGIHILFNRRNEPIANSVLNYIWNCNFYCQGQLIDNKYNINNPVTYPSATNPWTGYANANTRTDIGIMFIKNKFITLAGNRFDNSEYGIFGVDNHFNSYGYNLFTNHRKGIMAISTLSTILSGNNIATNTFDYIPGNTAGTLSADDGTAIYIAGGRGDRIFDGNQFFNIPNINPAYGIILNNTSGFDVQNNYYYNLEKGITIQNSSSFGGFVRAYSGTDQYNWQGNIFNTCKTGIITENNNSALCLRCNDHNNNSANFNANWDNPSVGILANQGFANSNFAPNDVQQIRFGAGNWFFPLTLRKVISPSPYTYYHHSNPIEYIPDNTGSPNIGLSDINIGFIYAKSVSCLFPIITDPAKNLPASLNDPVFLRIDSLNNVVTTLQEQYSTLLINADNGNTQQLLNAINAVPPSGQLKNMLLANSPLSDTVLIALNVKNPLSTGNYKLVMEENLPVTRKVVPSFNERLETLPPGIMSQLQAKQANNPGKITLGYLETLLGQVKLIKQLYFNQIISLLLDTLNNRYEDAITLFEREGSDAANIALAASYISDSNYSAAAAKIALLPDDESEAGVWKAYSTMLLNHFMHGKEIEELDSLQIEFIRSLAYQCPEGLATVNAKAILMYLFRETVPACPPNSIRNSKTENVTFQTQKLSWLGDNYPDPFTRNTIIPYYLPEGEKGELFIKDVTGRIIMKLNLMEGRNKHELETGKWADGIYFYEMRVNGRTVELKKMVKTE